MEIEEKYLSETSNNKGYGEGIKGFKIIQPKICQSCINSREGFAGKGKGLGDLECKLFDDVIDVHPYGTCPEWQERRG